MLKNIKDPITSIIGLGIIVVTVISVLEGKITWMWDGTAGVCVGALFFLIPDKIVSLILDTLKAVKTKFLGDAPKE